MHGESAGSKSSYVNEVCLENTVSSAESLHRRLSSISQSLRNACNSLRNLPPRRIRCTQISYPGLSFCQNKTTSHCLFTCPRGPHGFISPNMAAPLFACKSITRTKEKWCPKWGPAQSTWRTGMMGHRASMNLFQVDAVIIKRPCSR